jgi:mevalonate kinase
MNPSGIDQSVSTFGGVLSYKRGSDITHLRVKSVVPLLLGNTGMRRNTGKLVDDVRLRFEKFPQLFKSLKKIRGRAFETLSEVEQLPYP